MPEGPAPSTPSRVEDEEPDPLRRDGPRDATLECATRMSRKPLWENAIARPWLSMIPWRELIRCSHGGIIVWSPIMILLGKRTLTEFAESHAEAKPAIESWVAEVEAAQWRMPQDITSTFSATASILPGGTAIFNLKGKKFRLEVQITYQNGIVTVKRIGTHAEYNRW